MSHRLMLFVLAVLVSWASAGVAEPASSQPSADVDELAALRAEVIQLRMELIQQKSKISTLERENRQLKVMLRAAQRGQKTPHMEDDPDRETPTTQLQYRGRTVSSQWFDSMYQEFADKIVMQGTQFVCAGHAMASKPGIPIPMPADFAPGALRFLRPGPFRQAVVFQRLGDSGCLATISIAGITGEVPGRETEIYLEMDTRNLVDGTPLPDMPVVYVGPHTYTAALGATLTVPGYRLHRPLTRDEFAEALRNGFELIRYRAVTRKVPVRTSYGAGGFYGGTPVTRMEDRTEIVRTPIR
jgi:hypothetical protein